MPSTSPDILRRLSLSRVPRPVYPKTPVAPIDVTLSNSHKSYSPKSSPPEIPKSHNHCNGNGNSKSVESSKNRDRASNGDTASKLNLRNQKDTPVHKSVDHTVPHDPYTEKHNNSFLQLIDKRSSNRHHHHYHHRQHKNAHARQQEASVVDACTLPYRKSDTHYQSDMNFVPGSTASISKRSSNVTESTVDVTIPASFSSATLGNIRDNNINSRYDSMTLANQNEHRYRSDAIEISANRRDRSSSSGISTTDFPPSSSLSGCTSRPLSRCESTLGMDKFSRTQQRLAASRAGIKELDMLREKHRRMIHEVKHQLAKSLTNLVEEETAVLDPAEGQPAMEERSGQSGEHQTSNQNESNRHSFPPPSFSHISNQPIKSDHVIIENDVTESDSNRKRIDLVDIDLDHQDQSILPQDLALTKSIEAINNCLPGHEAKPLLQPESFLQTAIFPPSPVSRPPPLARLRQPSPPLTDISSHRSSLSMDSGCLSLASGGLGEPLYLGYPGNPYGSFTAGGCEGSHNYQSSADSTSLSGYGSISSASSSTLNRASIPRAMPAVFPSDDEGCQSDISPKYRVLNVEKSPSCLDLSSCDNVSSSGVGSHQSNPPSQDWSAGSVRSCSSSTIFREGTQSGGSNPVVSPRKKMVTPRPKSMYAYPEENTVVVTQSNFSTLQNTSRSQSIPHQPCHYASSFTLQHRPPLSESTASLPRPLSLQYYQYPSPMHAIALQSQECLSVYPITESWENINGTAQHSGEFYPRHFSSSPTESLPNIPMISSLEERHLSDFSYNKQHMNMISMGDFNYQKPQLSKTRSSSIETIDDNAESQLSRAGVGHGGGKYGTKLTNNAISKHHNNNSSNYESDSTIISNGSSADANLGNSSVPRSDSDASFASSDASTATESDVTFRANPIYIQPNASPPISKRRSPGQMRHTSKSTSSYTSSAGLYEHRSSKHIPSQLSLGSSNYSTFNCKNMGFNNGGLGGRGRHHLYPQSRLSGRNTSCKPIRPHSLAYSPFIENNIDNNENQFIKLSSANPEFDDDPDKPQFTWDDVKRLLDPNYEKQRLSRKWSLISNYADRTATLMRDANNNNARNCSDQQYSSSRQLDMAGENEIMQQNRYRQMPASDSTSTSTNQHHKLIRQQPPDAQPNCSSTLPRLPRHWSEAEVSAPSTNAYGILSSQHPTRYQSCCLTTVYTNGLSDLEDNDDSVLMSPNHHDELTIESPAISITANLEDDTASLESFGSPSTVIRAHGAWSSGHPSPVISIKRANSGASSRSAKSANSAHSGQSCVSGAPSSHSSSNRSAKSSQSTPAIVTPSTASSNSYSNGGYSAGKSQHSGAYGGGFRNRHRHVCRSLSSQSTDSNRSRRSRPSAATKTWQESEEL